MSRQGRNTRCRCGSGLKAKHCCDSPRGPSVDVVERAFIAGEVRRATPLLRAIRVRGELAYYVDELMALPRDLSELTVRLPVLVDPEIAHLLAAYAADDEQGVDDIVRKVRDRFDTPSERARLARAVARLRHDCVLSRSLAALAFLDLYRDDCPALIEAAVRQAAAIGAGVARTPFGLLVV